MFPAQFQNSIRQTARMTHGCRRGKSHDLRQGIRSLQIKKTASRAWCSSSQLRIIPAFSCALIVEYMFFFSMYSSPYSAHISRFHAALFRKRHAFSGTATTVSPLSLSAVLVAHSPAWRKWTKTAGRQHLTKPGCNECCSAHSSSSQLSRAEPTNRGSLP